jgi:hypothetical protein
LEEMWKRFVVAYFEVLSDIVGSLLGSIFDPENGSGMYLGISGVLQTTPGSDAEGPIPFIN